MMEFGAIALFPFRTGFMNGYRLIIASRAQPLQDGFAFVRIRKIRLGLSL